MGLLDVLLGVKLDLFSMGFGGASVSLVGKVRSSQGYAAE
jgi:hypothetical protein